jgi:hypothetical protein
MRLRYRPAGTREALPGAMPFRFSAKRRELALDFCCYCINFDNLKLKFFAKNSV